SPTCRCGGSVAPRSKRARSARRSVALSSPIRFCRTPRRGSTPRRAPRGKIFERGAAPRGFAGPVLTRGNARYGWPFVCRGGRDEAVGGVADVAGGHGAGLSRAGPLDDEDQLVAGMPVERKLRPGGEARHRGPPLRGRVLPENLEGEPGLELLPSQLADRDDL